MSTIRIIQFDASIRNNKVGIGMIDRTQNVSISKTLEYPTDTEPSSEIAETMGLITVLQYIQENNIERARLFTDNQILSINGISDYLYKKYLKNKKDNFSIHWLPRELNSDADKLSKTASTVSHAVPEFNVKHYILKYSTNERFNLLTKLASSKVELKIINKIKNNLILGDKNTKRSKFMRLALSFFALGEIPCVDKFVKCFPKSTRRKIRFNGSTLEEEIVKRIKE